MFRFICRPRLASEGEGGSPRRGDAVLTEWTAARLGGGYQVRQRELAGALLRWTADGGPSGGPREAVWRAAAGPIALRVAPLRKPAKAAPGGAKAAPAKGLGPSGKGGKGAPGEASGAKGSGPSGKGG